MQRGIPNVVWQPTLTGNAATLAKGTLKKASLLNGSFGVFAASVYDNKPVHLMTTAYTDSTWIMKERKWYQSGKVSVRVYRRLLLIDLYNQFMDGVDLKDQLCWYYRFCGKHMWRTQVCHAHKHSDHRWSVSPPSFTHRNGPGHSSCGH